MKPIIIPDNFNYIAAFLTFSCQLRCSYCINHHNGDLDKKRWMDRFRWVIGLNRIQTRPDLPITFQGGEPTVHKHFFDILKGLREDIPIDILTNLVLPVEQFLQIPPARLRRIAPYASIRVSYHNGQSDFKYLLSKVLKMQDWGYSIGIWEVDHPAHHDEVLKRQRYAIDRGIDYRLKEFLGPWNGKNYGTLRYKEATNASQIRRCECRTNELLIDPAGYIFRCASDLYANRCPIGHILDESPPPLGEWRKCAVYGRCNSCDIKIKTNRFQEYGYSSVEIRNVSEPYMDNKPVENVINTYGRQQSYAL